VRYDIRHKETGVVTEMTMSYKDLTPFLESHPELEVVFLNMNVGDPVLLGVKKIPSDFEHGVLSPIERNYFKKRRESKFSSLKQQV